MIDYRKANAEVREAYFKYLETGEDRTNAASFVAGWNAAMASMGFEHDEKICSMEATQFDNAECIRSEEPAKEPEPEHRAGPMPDPGEGYRILSKDPPEELAEGDELLHPRLGGWHESIHARWGYKRQDTDCWYRRKIETDKPAWEPKVGDWVKVTRPKYWKECRNPDWSTVMHQYDDNVMQVARYEQRYGAWVANFYGHDWFFHRDWLSPAEPPASEKPSEPEYREPVLPADVGKSCEFSITGEYWYESLLKGFQLHDNPWVSSDRGRWNYARIKINP